MIFSQVLVVVVHQVKQVVSVLQAFSKTFAAGSFLGTHLGQASGAPNNALVVCTDRVRLELVVEWTHHMFGAMGCAER